MHRTAARPAPLNFHLPTHPHTVDRRKDIGLAHALPHFVPEYLEAPIRDGLRTPPADDMGTAYQHPQYNNYAVRQDATYSVPVTRGSNYGASDSYVSTALQPKPYSTLNHQPPSSLSLPNGIHNHNFPSSSQPNSRVGTVVRTDGPLQRKSTTNEISPNLRIPPGINNSGGSLAEFAAQITCLFWFESTDILRKAEKMTASSSPVMRLRDEALPSSGFRKWVVTILSTTQVTQNVILLALLFIYRLKTINPAVKGRSGSEYRLLTVALMLGNKFLDDNTYTNKTWAEVSGISVTEIHIMEVEFLSNMRYSLLASEEQWQEWQEKLGSFWIYCDRASRAPYTLPSPTPLSAQSQQSTLPSPPASMQASPPSLTNSYPPNTGPFSPSQSWSNHSYSAPVVSPLPLPTVLELQSLASRKRSHEDDIEEPVAKRLTRSATTGHPLSNVPSIMRHDVPRLPVPNLTISTSQPPINGYAGAPSYSQNVPLLPPLNARSMSTVYPSTPSWTPQLPMLTPTGPPTYQYGPPSAGDYTTPTRRHSPHSIHDLLSLGSSPVNASFPSQTGHPSPSFFLQQRNSPYKPVRHVNTLLYPPPSASMHDYSANIDQMHYQPLGKRNDYRPGVVPDYTFHNYQQWPVLPQPNFHA